MAGAVTIASILNIDKTLDLPFIFGGDGATLLVPPEILNYVKTELLGSKEVASRLDLELRAGVVPVKDIYKNGKGLLIGKHALTKSYSQAVFQGDGYDYAEKLVKNPQTRKFYEITGEAANPNINGLTCRWQPIKSTRGEIVSIIIRTQKNSFKDISNYQAVSDKIIEIYGTESLHHPLSIGNLKLSLNTNDLAVESKSGGGGFFQTLKLFFVNFYGFLSRKAGKMMTTEDKIQMMIANTDFKKFDGSIKMVISGDKSHRLELVEYLEDLYQKAEIFYGVHVSDSALITCLVLEGTNKEVHFVDGNNGGYALAAKNLKLQIAKADF